MAGTVIPILLLLFFGMHIFAIRKEADLTAREKQREVLKRQAWAIRPLTVGWTLFNLCLFYGLALGPFLKQWKRWDSPAWLDHYLGVGFLLLCLFLVSAYGIWHVRRLIDVPGRIHWAYHVCFALSAVFPLAGLIYMVLIHLWTRW